MWRRYLLLPVAALIVALDQLTKSWIRANIPLGGSLEEVFRVRIIHIQNTGAVFGIFPGQSLVLTVVAFIALVMLSIFFYRFGRSSLLGVLAIGLVFGGALGNLIDRLMFAGAVTDFIYVRLWGDFFWPAFNVADASLSIGIVLLIIYILWGMGLQIGTKS